MRDAETRRPASGKGFAMAFDFTGRRVVVAGGSRGIGRSIALAFAQAGAVVSVCARGAEGIARVRGELAAHGHLVHAATCDLGDADAIARYIAEAASALGKDVSIGISDTTAGRGTITAESSLRVSTP